MSDSSPRGLVCPRCGKRRWETTNTERLDGRIRRRRVCRSCGYKITTLELALRDVRDFEP